MMMIHLTCAVLLIAALTPPTRGSAGTLYAAAPEGRGAYHVGGKGVYNYGYNTGDGIAKVEVKHADGTVTGSYRYFDPNGQQIVRSYIADSRGFRVLGNQLPSAHDSPALGFLDSQTLTGAVEGTQEFSTLKVQPSSDSSLLFNRQTPGIPFNHGQNAHHAIETNIIQTENEKIIERQKLIEELELKQKKILKEYQDRLEKHKQQINALQSQIAHHREDQATVVQQHVPQQVQQRSAGSDYFTSINTAAGGNYFYSDDVINYDFPSGFAYTVQPVPLQPVAVHGFRQKNLVTAGRTPNRRHNAPLATVRGHTNRRVNHPFVVGYRHNRY